MRSTSESRVAGPSNQRRNALALALLALGAVSLHSPRVQAQAAPLPTPPGFEQPSGLAYGSFDLYARMQAGLKFTDNVRLDPTEKSDAKKLLALDGVARSKWKRHAAAATVSYLRMDAVDTPDEENDALSATLSGRYDFSDTLKLKLGLLRQESIIGKNDPLQFNGSLNGTTRTDTLEAALEWDDGQRFANLLARWLDVSNDTHVDVDVLNRVQSQDREETNLTLQVGRHFDWGQAYLFGGPQRVTYTGSAVILPEDRDSSGGRLGAGAEFKHGDLQGIVRLIAFGQYFDAPTIPEVESLVGTVQLSYTLDTRWAVAGALERSFDETNIQTSGGLFTNLAALGVLYSPRKDLYLKVGPSYRFYEIAGTPYEANSLSLDATAAWQVTDRVEILCNATVSDQEVNDDFLANLEYGEQALTLSAVVAF